jgi:hypothetical protein
LYQIIFAHYIHYYEHNSFTFEQNMPIIPMCLTRKEHSMEALENKMNITEQLERADVVDSWTQFTRANGLGSSASRISEVLEAGKFIEVADRKFQGTPIVLLRKSDYEKLLINSRTSFRVKKLLGMIGQAIVSFKQHKVDQETPSEIHIIETTLSLGLELTQDIQPLYASREDYLSKNSDAEVSGENDFDLPASKSELEDGVSVEK